tara:strand:- start:342 stop:1241 length:900 start_codon:yes stop_codon:yes gene_type:complete
MQDIPKKIHFYWSMDQLCYLQYLTIVSFHKTNPDFEINIYYPCKKSDAITWQTDEQKGRVCNFIDYLDELKALPYVKWHEVDITKICNFLDNESPEVFKSDFLRMHLLSTQGGFWSDIDILFYNNMNHFSGIERQDKDALLCCDTDYYIGLMAALPESSTFRKLINEAERKFNKDEYQCIGSRLYRKMHKQIVEGSNYFHTMCFYPFGWQKAQLRNFFYQLHTNIQYINFDSDGESTVEDYNLQQCIGVHWCNGNKFSELFCRYFNHTNQTEFFPTTLGFIMNKVFATDENYYSNSILQ